MGFGWGAFVHTTKTSASEREHGEVHGRYGTRFSSTSSGSKEKKTSSSGVSTTVALTQCTSSSPKVSTRVKFRTRLFSPPSSA